ncbi:MAG: hypothetical protein EZS28_053909, partial [Streblomastix strix]
MAIEDYQLAIQIRQIAMNSIAVTHQAQFDLQDNLQSNEQETIDICLSTTDAIESYSHSAHIIIPNTLSQNQNLQSSTAILVITGGKRNPSQLIDQKGQEIRLFDLGRWS